MRNRCGIARAGVGDAHHRADRRRGREDVGCLVAGEEIELPVGVEAALALEHELDGAQAPRPDERADAGGPGPLAHAVEALAVLDVVAVDELLVAEDVAMGVQDALREAGRAGRVVELGGIVGRGVDALELGVAVVEAAGLELDDLREPLDARAVGGVRHDDARLRVAEPVADPLVPVEDRHRQQDRAGLPRAEERRRRLGRRRQQHRDPVAALHAALGQQPREAVGHVLQLAPVDLADRAVGILVDHRELVARVLVTDVRGDVVALGHLPRVRGTRFLVGHVSHRTLCGRRCAAQVSGACACASSTRSAPGARAPRVPGSPAARGASCAASRAWRPSSRPCARGAARAAPAGSATAGPRR